MKPLLLAILALAVLAPLADAAKFTGRTSQDRSAKVRTNSRGFPVFVAIRWRASCSDGGRLALPTGFKPPYRERTRTFVRDSGPYTTRVTDKQDRVYDVRVSAHVRARRVTKDTWRGSFGASAEVSRNGSLVSRCKTGSITWRASR
jgi:hypothetical protein